MKNIIYLLAALLVFNTAFADSTDGSIQLKDRYVELGNNLLAEGDDSVIEDDDDDPVMRTRKNRSDRVRYRDNKSPMIASGLSLILPGAGELYAKDYLRAGIFLGVEAGLLAMYYVNDKDGDDKTDKYKDFANSKFDEDMYYGGLIRLATDSLKYSENANLDYFSNRDNWTSENKDWNDDHEYGVTQLLSLVTGEAGTVTTNTGFTHNLPKRKTQQYYEMIGKYYQFGFGWSDFNGWERNEAGEIVIDENGLPVLKEGVTIEAYDKQNSIWRSESHVDSYEDFRDEANKAYEAGQNYLMITLLNHVASAFDASYVVKKNYSIKTKLRIENTDKSAALGYNNYKLTYSVAW